MTTRVELPDGQWAELREPASLTNGQRKPFMLAFTRAVQQSTSGTDESAAATLAVGDATIVVLIDSWSLDKKLPCDEPAVLDELDIGTYDTLAKACAALIPDLEQSLAPSPPKPSPAQRKRSRAAN